MRIRTILKKKNNLKAKNLVLRILRRGNNKRFKEGAIVRTRIILEEKNDFKGRERF